MMASPTFYDLKILLLRMFSDESNRGREGKTLFPSPECLFHYFTDIKVWGSMGCRTCMCTNEAK